MPRSKKIGIFIGLCWLYFSIHLDRQILGILADSIKSDLRLQDQQLGTLTGSAFSMVYALMGLYFGRVADHSDRLVLVRIGAWIWSLGSISAALAPGYEMLIASRAGVALGEAIATPAAVSLMAELAGTKYRASAASVFAAGAFVGAGAAAIVGGAIIDGFRGATTIVGWRAAMVAVGVPGIIGALYLSFFRLPMSAQSSTQHGESVGVTSVLVAGSTGAILLQMYWPSTWGVPASVLLVLTAALWWAYRLRRGDIEAYLATLGQAPFRLFLGSFAAVLFMDVAASFWLLPYALRHFALRPSVAGAQLGGLVIVAGIIGTLLGGGIADRWRRARPAGRIWTALIAVLAEGAAILIALAQTDYRGFLLAFAAFCVASGGWAGVAAAIGLDLLPSAHRGTGTAAYFLMTAVLGSGLGAFAVGLGSDVFGSLSTALAWSSTISLVAAAGLIGLGNLVVNKPHR